jgi:trigger factor
LQPETGPGHHPKDSLLARSLRPEGKTLSSTDTLENTPPTETAVADREHDSPEQQGHHHEGHTHPPEPVLNPDCVKEVVIDVPADEVNKAYRTVCGEYSKRAKFPGFRAGKVPVSVVKRRFAVEVQKAVMDSLLSERFNQAIDALGVRPVGQPQTTELNLKEGEPLHLKVAFEHVPPFSIEGYRNELAKLREAHATVEPVEEDRPLHDGDWAQISYKGHTKDQADDAPIVGEDTLVEVGAKHTLAAFSSALRGARRGQELKAEVIYPADYHQANLAGKTVTYDVEVKAIKKRTLPELDDDFAREVGANENYAEFERQLREHVAIGKRRSMEAETKERLLAALTERYPFPVPESLVQEQIDARLDRGLRALAAQGMETEQMRKLDFARLRAAQRDSATAEVRTFILLDRIAQDENITVSDEELDHELQLAALQSREPVDTLKVRLTADGGLARIREQLRREKTASVMYERLPA